jgi:cytochrome o ubiquinol oxidase subunit 3
MSATLQSGAGSDPYRLGRGGAAEEREPSTEHGERSLASKRIIVGYGFWIFLLSDIIMFSAFFAAYAVLENNTAGGPAGKELFSQTNAAIETACLLLSSFTCGIASIAAQRRQFLLYQGAMLVTAVLGIAFLVLESREFADMVSQGNGPSRSAFLSSFFALVGCHGIHVTLGTMWLFTMMAQVAAKGFRADIMRRLLCFNLFWHALDIIWVALFTVVYLMGTAR